MAEDKVITLRFQEWKKLDMELYRNLEKGKQELGMSMPGYVKKILRQHVEKQGKESAGADICMEQIREIVREELAAQSAALTGAFERMAEKLPDGIRKAGDTGQLQEPDAALPEYSDGFPDGLDGVLEKFL